MQDAVRAVEARESDSDSEAAKPDAASAVTEALIAAKKELEEALSQTQKEAAELRDKWLRAAAEFDNLKKRAARDKENTVKFANESMLRDLLPVLDDFDRALTAVAAPSDDDAHKQLFEGIQMVHRAFMGQLEKHGVTPFECVGEPFDPNLQEAVQQVPSEVEAGRVAQELRRGFMLNGRLLRPAMVTVSLGPPGEAESPAADGADAPPADEKEE